MSNTSDTALVITACATAITALGGLAVAVSVLLPTMRTARKAVGAVQEVHTIVNQQRTDAQRYQVALVAALREGGVAVPVDQSLSVPAPASLPP
jgi:hypothetical protein